MTCMGKLTIELTAAEERFVKIEGRSQGLLQYLPEAKGRLIANFPNSHVVSLYVIRRSPRKPLRTW